VKIVLIRHAQPAWTPDGRVSNDPELTELGRRQARLLGDRNWDHLDELWVSPMLRAQQTAIPVAETSGLEPVTLDWMAEIAPAEWWEGSPVDEVADLMKFGNLRPVEELWDGLPQAESFRDFHVRVTGGLEATLTRFGLAPDESQTGLWKQTDGHAVDGSPTIGFVAHGGTNAVTLSRLLGVTPAPWEWDRFDSAHTSVATLLTRPIADRSAFGMIGFGDVTHLDAEMVTR
jgi:probable phosphoglycerate mutase